MPAVAPEIVLERLRGLPGGEALLEAAAERDDVELVGGAVRDLLLGREPRELDVVVGGEDATASGEAATFGGQATLFAQRLDSDLNAPVDLDVAGGEIDAPPGTSSHERFGTARVVWDGGRIDVATRRAESYPAPGALPDVRAGTEREDLERRDFTVNAIAVRLGGDRRGELRALPNALSDLGAGRLRVLHEQSFSDDPTRLLRLARYTARLGFEVEEHTAALASAALAERVLETVSGARIGAELRLALGEADAVASLAALSDLGVLDALHPRLRFEQPVARTTLELLPEDGRPDLALLASSMLPLVLRAQDDHRAEIAALLDRWDFPAGDRDRVAASAIAVPRLIEELPAAAQPSAIRAAARGVPLEGIALAGALGCQEPACSWLQEVRHVSLEITGEDLLMAGVPEGTEIGRRLEAVLQLRLDGELAGGREAELAAALEAYA